MTTGYINAVMPRDISAGFKIGPKWKTPETPMDNGTVIRNAQWRYPLWCGSGNMAAFTPAKRQALVAMFVATRGKWAAFKVWDPTENTAVDEVIAPVVGTSTPVQLSKRFYFPGSTDIADSADIKIRCPIIAATVIKVDGSPVTVTIDEQTGLATPAAPWAAGTYTWSGRYYRWMRFDSDWGAFTANAQNLYTADIELIEDRGPP